MSDVNKSSVKEPVITNQFSCSNVILNENTCTLNSELTCPSNIDVPSSPVSEICTNAQVDTTRTVTASQTSELDIAMQSNKASPEDVAKFAISGGPSIQEEAGVKEIGRLSDANIELKLQNDKLMGKNDEGQVNVCESEIESNKCIDDAWKDELLSGTELGKIYHRQKLKNSPRLNKMFERQYRLQQNKVKDVCEEDACVQKVAKLATDLARRKYKFPKAGEEEKLSNMVTKDERSILEMYRDILDCINEKVSEEELNFLSSVIGYDASVKQYSSEGVPLPDSLVKQLSAEYKKMHNIKTIGKSYEHMRGLKIEEKIKKEKKNFNDYELEGTALKVEKLPKFSLPEVAAFLEFIEKDSSVLETRRHKRQVAAIKRMFNKKKCIGLGSLHTFLTQFNEKYMFDKKYVDPVVTPQILLLAAGERLVYAQCLVDSAEGEVTFSPLLDSGATHNLLPKNIIDKNKIKLLKWQPRKGFPLSTAGSQVNNAIMSECVVRLKIKTSGTAGNYIDVPFLVCNEALSITGPILGKSFLNDFRSDEKHRSAGRGETRELWCDMMSQDTHEKVRGLLPTSDWPGDKQSKLFLLNGDKESLVSEEEGEDDYGMVSAVRAGDMASDLLSYLGGDGVTVSQPVRNDIDSEAFKKVDLMEALKREPPKKSVKIGPTPEKYKNKLVALNEKYASSYARGDIQCGEFKLDVLVDPEVEEGETAVQAKRKNQDHSTFSAVQEQMSKLEAQGIIEISNDQSTSKYVHNLLTVPKKPSGSSLRQWTKADQNIEKRSDKMSKEDIPVRILADLTTLNKILKSTPAISLPEETEVKSFIHNKIISLYDIKNGYFSLKVKESAKELFNFYYKNMIWTYARMPQGLSSAPFYFMVAMAKMLSQAAFDEFKQKNEKRMKHLFRCAKSFEDVTKYYLDDIILATPIICGCKGESFGCDKGFNCPKLKEEETSQLHLEAHELILFAVERAGMLLESTKCSHFTQDSFVFLGVEYCGTESTYSISKERVASMLSFRIPRSIAELNSRLSSIFYSNAFMPWLKKLALRLTRMVKSGHFKWGQEENECFNNLKLLTAISISKNFFDPSAHLMLMVDSSKYSGSFCAYQLLKTGELQLLDTDTVILSGAESRNSPVQRELSNLVWGIDKIEKYILSTENPVQIIGDAHCIQYLKNQRLWDSRCGHISLLLSKYQHLNFFYVPGKFLGLVDALSRGFHNVFIEKKESELSRELAQVLPPLPEEIRNNIYMMSARELTDYIMSMKTNKVKYDIYDKGAFCNQSYREDDLRVLFTECQPLQVLLAFLKDPYNPDHLTSNSAKHFFGVLTGANKTKIEKFIKDNGLERLRDVLKTIDYKTTWQSYYPAQVKLQPAPVPAGQGKVTVVTRSGNAVCRAKWAPDIKCKHLQENKDELSPEVLSLFSQNISKYDQTMSSLKLAWKNSENIDKVRLMEPVLQFKESSCIVEKFIKTKDVARRLREMPAHKWFFPDMNEFAFVPFYNENNMEIDLVEREGKLCLTLKNSVTLESLEFVRLKCWASVLSGNTGWRETISKKFKCYHVSTYLPYTVCTSVSLFNVTEDTICIKKGTILFTLEQPGEGDKVFSYLKLRDCEGQKLLHGIYDLNIQSKYNNLENIFVDYLELCNINLIQPALRENLGAGRAADPKQKAKLSKFYEKFIGNNEDGFRESLKARGSDMTRDELFEGQYNLSLLLFNHHIRLSKCKISRNDILALQASDELIVKLKDKVLKSKVNQTNQGGREQVKFTLINDILYKQTFNEKRHITFKSLVIPRFLMKEICRILHYEKQLHLGEKESVTLIKNAFWSFDMLDLARRARESCFACLYGSKARSRQTRGDTRIHLRNEIQIKKVLECDLMFLAKDSILKTDCAIVFVCPLSNYTISFPIQSKEAPDICKALGILVSTVGAPKILKTDGGTEFCNFKVKEFLDKLQIIHWIGATKNSTSSVERQILELKGVLNSLIQSENLGNNRWSPLLPMACSILQARPVRGGAFLSRLQTFMSPHHYQNQTFKLIEINNEQQLFTLHKNFCTGTQLRVKSAATASEGQQWIPGQLAKTHIPRSDQVSKHGSNQLLPVTNRFLRILDPPTKKQAAICEDLLSSETGKFSNSKIRGLNLRDFPLPRQICIRNMDTVPEINSGNFARNLFAKDVQPKCFTLEQIQNLKSSLKKKSQFSEQICNKLYKGVMADNKAQLEAYASALQVIRGLQSEVPIPKWMINLFSQREGYGKLKHLLENKDSPDLDAEVKKCGHQNRVHWDNNTVIKEFVKGSPIQLFTPEMRVFCVSGRELWTCFYTMCSLNCSPDCGAESLTGPARQIQNE